MMNVVPSSWLKGGAVVSPDAGLPRPFSAFSQEGWNLCVHSGFPAWPQAGLVHRTELGLHPRPFFLPVVHRKAPLLVPDTTV